MKMPEIAYQSIDWSKVEPTTHNGAPGTATWRVVETGNLRIRVVEYTPGYIADHWCERGHVVFVLQGEVINEIKDGRRPVIKAGESFVLGDGADTAHRWSTPQGARVFIVD